MILVNSITNLFDTRWKKCVPEESNHFILKERTEEEMAYLLSPTWHISEKTPKTLLIHGMDDVTVHPQHSQCFYDEMRLHGREATLCWIAHTEHAFLLAEYMLEQQKPLLATSLAIDIIDELIGI